MTALWSYISLGACRLKVDPELEELSTNQKVMDAGIVFFQVDLPLASDVVTTSQVQNPPAVQVYQDGKKVDEAQGGNLAPVKKWVEALAGLF